MKLTDKDKASLQACDGKKGNFSYFLILFIPIFFIIIAIFNLYTANQIGMYEGHNITDLFNDWIEGYESNKTYSGIYLKAREKFFSALMLITFAIVAGIMALTKIKEIKRNRKIIAFLKKHNEWID